MKKQKRTNDKNLALLSVILGAASFTNTIFTGIPAIILGIIALKKKAGDRTQAILGIVFGTLGSLLLIPIILLALHFLREPFKEQYSVPQNEKLNMAKIVEGLQEYKKKNGKYPYCTGFEKTPGCADWDLFLRENQVAAKYPTEFENASDNIEDRPAGTLVYAQATTCFLNTPAQPDTLDDDSFPKKDPSDYVALVYFHEGGRACFSVEST